MMEVFLLLARTALAAILGIAGFAKLSDRAGTRQAMIGFGIPESIAAAPGILVPVAELIVAVALIPASTARMAALAAAAMFLIFVLAISYQLANGRHPDCHCFGQLHSRPIGPATVVRNGALFALALGVAAFPAPLWASGLGWASTLGGPKTLAVSGFLLILLILVVGEGWMLLNLARQQGRLLLRLDAIAAQVNGHAGLTPTQPNPRLGLQVGSLAPPFELPSLEGPIVSLDHLREAGKPVLLLSVDPGCGPCSRLVPEIAEWQRAHADVLTVAVLTRGSADANRGRLANHGLSRVLLQKGQEAAEQYRMVVTPSAVLIDRAGKISGPVAAGVDDIRRLVDHVLHPSQQRVEALPIGSPAPPVKLFDLNGVRFDLHDRNDQLTVLLFWDPGCGFCQRMLPDLQSWQAERGAERNLVFVSRGSVEENRELLPRSTVVIEGDFAVARKYGASGTPSAVLVRGGRVASELAVGASAVLGLLVQLDQSPSNNFLPFLTQPGSGSRLPYPR